MPDEIEGLNLDLYEIAEGLVDEPPIPYVSSCRAFECSLCGHMAEHVADIEHDRGCLYRKAQIAVRTARRLAEQVAA